MIPTFDGVFESCESGDYTGIFFKFKIEYWIHKKGEGGAAIVHTTYNLFRILWFHFASTFGQVC